MSQHELIRIQRNKDNNNLYSLLSSFMRGCIEEITSVADGMKVVGLASIVYVSYLQEVLFFMVLGGGGEVRTKEGN